MILRQHLLDGMVYGVVLLTLLGQGMALHALLPSLAAGADGG